MPRNEIVLRLVLPEWSRGRSIALTLALLLVGGAAAWGLTFTAPTQKDLAGTQLSSTKVADWFGKIQADLATLNTNNKWSAANGNANDIVNTNPGRVGIGTPSPQTTLDVGGDVSWGRGAGVLEFGGGRGLPDRAIISSRKGMNLSLGADNFDQVVISTSGDVGIGTPSPIGRLEVRTATDGWTARMVSTNIKASNGLYVETATQDAASVALQVRTASGDKLVVRNSGNVGIGSVNPSSRLHVEQSGGDEKGGVTLALNGRACQLFVVDSKICPTIANVASYPVGQPGTTRTLCVRCD